ncbi:carbohydrate-binding protein [Cohnella hashimotonis]|uniref:Carbohydrate-binding protein n=1 Tax=Cohnella hashimotonis TaxID=2826895 RepID=A0ABT6TMD8_9BACL|nr:carbohydrate-binding protein [Cohnella hashimotonis]MDI4647438.1 carbohydrate-binding protein [Cohnella hashimotonis]
MLKRFGLISMALILFLGLLGLKPDSAKAAPTNTNFGFATGYVILNKTNAELDSYLNQIAASGAAYIRFDFSWALIQAGGSSSYDFTDTDRVVDAAIAKGIKILALPTGVTAWSGDPVPSNASSYQNFMYNLGLHYIPKGVTDWELWNEPNIQGISPAAYTQKILIPGATGIRQAATQLGKTVRVISGGLAPAATDGTNYSPLDYVTGIYANGGKNYFDALGHHPYTWPADPTIPTLYNTLLNSQQLYDVMAANGDGAKKMWATEFGYPTNSISERGVTEAQQAQYMVDAYNIWKGFSYSGGPWMMYSFKDNGTDVMNPEDFFGLIRFNGTAKPAYAAVVNMMANNPPGSGGTQGTYVYEAENGTYGNGAQVINETNASNGQDVGYLDNVGAYSQINNVNGGPGGTAALVIRFSNGNGASRTLSLYVNGVKQQQLSFANTGAWTTFANTASINIPLNAGTNNTIKIQRDSTDTPEADIDKYTVTTSAAAPTYYKIQNRWKPNEYLYDGGTRVNYGSGTTDAYLWSFESVGANKRIKNKATGEYINIKNGATHVESTAIASTDMTSQWTTGSASASSSAQYIKSASNNNYINVEDQLGYATSDIAGAPSDTAWYSAQWFFIQQ